ncbi:MAG: hypothetical protein KKC80_02950 [Candidatus Margulisbacteria bacterium]|nr:hypothetical protein [Candidatus Margulisiibacteriota bacterium]MBU1616823.1 hypothetical protein [Candidatus Margulisiibacteriota bacterium]
MISWKIKKYDEYRSITFCFVSATGKKKWFFKIVYQRVVSAEWGTPKVGSALTIRFLLPALKNQCRIIGIKAEQIKIKQPAKPSGKKANKKPASGLRRGQGQINLPAALAAAETVPSSPPGGWE